MTLTFCIIVSKFNRLVKIFKFCKLLFYINSQYATPNNKNTIATAVKIFASRSYTIQCPPSMKKTESTFHSLKAYHKTNDNSTIK